MMFGSFFIATEAASMISAYLNRKTMFWNIITVAAKRRRTKKDGGDGFATRAAILSGILN
jgi:hypothetical protein